MIGASPPCFYLVLCLQLLPSGLQSSSRKVGFKKCAKEESISRSGKTGGSKFGKSSSANPFSGSIGPAKKPQSQVNQVSDDNNEGYRQKIGKRKSRQADSRLSGFNHYKRKRIRFCNILKEVYSHLPNIAQTAGIVVTNPTTRGDDGCQFWAGKLDFLHAKVSLSFGEPSNEGNRALVGEPCVTDSNIPVIVRR
jgi:hypothetical protein